MLVYERTGGEAEDLAGELETGVSEATPATADHGGRNADDLNPFRRRYFQAFAVEPEAATNG